MAENKFRLFLIIITSSFYFSFLPLIVKLSFSGLICFYENKRFVLISLRHSTI
ncbi:hypothetical protein C7433_101336 [Pantoea sp. PNA 03-3]|nr:hypothetical protein C7433_101336 [Pantoea sp. PNA 03-3]